MSSHPIPASIHAFEGFAKSATLEELGLVAIAIKTEMGRRGYEFEFLDVKARNEYHPAMLRTMKKLIALAPARMAKVEALIDALAVAAPKKSA